MGIEKTELSLNKFDYKFEKINNKIIVKLDFAQRIIIDFSDPEKIKITDRLVGWNFLTGLIEMSLKNATLYNFIGAIIMTILFVYLDLEYDGLNFVFFFLAFVIWMLLWTLFYLFKAENLKRILISWNE
ncbi:MULTISPECIES: hypothetical protein [Leeuwenhoekiella]|jgi:hypothetical protein|uniref:Uncharacterized protein n=1 Tax=Leeuwenhoekiella blandensis (strain CECT 7118 / CCUG 51940 / KCTC 22103 / MED217) TaxID=398720 RepID=A3XMW1_LEEBM|nr:MULTISPECIES: hypothetical protein [Leeuwenhoekiella]EAQ49118.1 hypothetical protein MED217_06931 [Leeuwenhoekiella blandensis MED217]MAO45429.1 hypothetical protein [Leeuwenhoekiella sp.]MBQ51593.1 hypothetical protein [Leeuwenhoekiella sp.]HCW64948.1 hypothetical protein [Leeuwenhoekiella sp.]|tara:strand:- start:1112 stop:1498 length:387 start_codon:yes stop_codon:yes gene_type:complete